ncbi:Uncharacterized protein yohN precursor [Erwinia sp. Ejp617]|nr:Uncharacterized protein yohN precursor [Erwinia sp. Ejp617]
MLNEDIKMKKTTLSVMIGIFTAGAFFTNFSHAHDPGDGPDRSWHQQQGEHDNRGDERRAVRSHNDRGYGSREGPGERTHFTWRGDDFRRGHPAPQRYRGDDYRVDDWRDRGLEEPPRGAHWAYIDGNYVLIAVATGLVTAIIVGNLSGHH